MFDTEIKVIDAFHVTKDEIKEVKAFTMRKATYNGYSDITFYSTQKGWLEASTSDLPSIGHYRDLVYDKGEAEKLKVVKMRNHLESIEKQQAQLKEQADALKAELNK
jgi:hypothetical protein